MSSYSSRVIQKLHGRDEIFANIGSDEDENDTAQDIKTKTVSNKFSLLNQYEEDNQSDGDNDDEKSYEDVTTFPVDITTKKKKKQKQKKKQRQEKKRDYEASTSKANIKQPNEQAKSVLFVEHRHLNPDNEIRKIFGSRVLMADRRRHQRPLYKGVWLSRPQAEWGTVKKSGISMELVDTLGNSVKIFKFAHNNDYQEKQRKFLDAVDSADHRRIAAILNENPYHVDSLLTFSDIYKINEDLKMARDLLEKCLYYLEISFHHSFNMTTGKSTLPYKYQENRCMFLCLFKHMNFVAQRGCNRTALELCKFLLSLDPEEDPLCTVFLLDYFALRAAEYEFVVRFHEQCGKKRNLSLLPNWSFSLALAHFYIARESGTDNMDKADKALQDALIMFPTVLLTLLEKCSVQPDSVVTSNPYFNKDAKESTSEGLQLLCQLFVERNHTLWKDEDVLAWVETNVRSVIDILKAKQRKNFVSESTKRRRSRYQKPPLNVYRHTIMSDFPGLNSFIPLDIRASSVLVHDPLPPPDTIITYERRERPAPNLQNQSPHLLNLFLNSLFPDFDPDNPLPAQNNFDDDDYQNVGLLRNNAQNLMDAMREVLANFQIPLRESDQEEFADEWD